MPNKKNVDLSKHPIQQVAKDVAEGGEFAMFSVLLPVDGSDASVSRVLPHTPEEGAELTEQQVNDNMVMAVALAELAITWLPVEELLAMKAARQNKTPVDEGSTEEV
jgi:hypothetical protein